MTCELCGKEVSKTTTVKVEGSEMEVCEDCKKYGKEVLTSEKKNQSTKQVLQRIKNKKRTSGSSNKYEEKIEELALDYSERIENARLEDDLTQEELAKKINEKKSVISKLEKEDMRPSEDLRKKLENTLDIKLTEKIERTPTKTSEKTEGLTIGDLIEEET
ncbi:MAG: TIGR00270 family protein [Candidatus Thermoplasmatota archaeon]|nr:TIGR00270 family protein [Candidatus Thermoplasmatota archaeon]MBS3789374.1 TIGR00270 family protein [Candidatus Thermoplasmatota archaeon]